MSRIILYLKALCICKNNITVCVCIVLLVVIKLWFLCHFSNETGDQSICVILDLEFYGFVCLV